MRSLLYILTLVSCSIINVSCESLLQKQSIQRSAAKDATNAQLSETRRHIQAAQVDIELLQEQLDALQKEITSLKQEVAEGRHYAYDIREKNQQQLLAYQEKQNHIFQEIKQIKERSNETIDALKSLRSDIVQTKEISFKQYQTAENKIYQLKNSIESVLDIMQKSQNTIYIVKPGDTLEKIAHKHKASVQEIKEINHLTTDLIRAGQELKMP